jgi:O-acetylserine/cysteine efflux transporter
LLTSFIFESGQIEAVSSAPWVAWATLAYAVIGGSFIGHTGYYILLSHYEVSLVGAMLLIGPVIGVLGGVLILGEPFTPLIVIGSAMTLLGVAVVLKRSEIPIMKPAEGV